MGAIHSKSTFLHGQVRRGLQSGRYAPGQRIDPATLAAEFNTSLTPVRFALYRLVGEGMIHDHARHGFQVPLPTEMGMRDLYDWMERLLVMASELGNPRSPARQSPPPSTEDDLPKQTWKLFNAIARDTGRWSLHRAVKRANDRLAPIRRAKQDLIDHAAEELAELTRLWQAHDTTRLNAALHAYHERRKQLVPCIVALLTERSKQLP
ncbi:GntR family transcriptional regulator [Pseudoxanthomonas sp.]|uniref:GntR family transcriptional regulator n=1 Tax=Pseudoxanthomonas sp. TaxID=1871049 RepID=UPI002635EBC3|nr:GntR family transcriptional regulator [Pseudoxanthomonas sp.]WDS34744.1 MAG: GntR family transcriptional regulator [Pseudoxanthomonas sp.]